MYHLKGRSDGNVRGNGLWCEENNIFLNQNCFSSISESSNYIIVLFLRYASYQAWQDSVDLAMDPDSLMF